MTPVLVHLVRHGKVASHRGDVPVTPEGYADIERAAHRFAAAIQPGECVHVLYSPTLRARETALGLHAGIQKSFTGDQRTEILPTTDEWAVRNPDMFIAGERVEMVSTGEAMAEQIPHSGLVAHQIDQLPFYGEFFHHRDRVGFWVEHEDPPGENAQSVAHRVISFAVSLLDRPRDRAHRYICVTHSPIMRAVLHRYLLDRDPGEPGWVESIDLEITASDDVNIAFRDQRRRVARR